ncbi:MAG: class I SAM-dependent methyltransferase [Elusimicrobia bacterium]|nr:class I SAM-dependent methyltransferase [Elusimicrobiota bacterium]
MKILRETIRNKKALRAFYEDCYQKFKACLAHCPTEGEALEIGSGGGFCEKVIPGVVTSDFLPYEGVSRVMDARRLEFPNESLRAIFMLNAFHHVCDPGRFLEEAERCLRPGGRLFIIDQHPGILGYPLLRLLHHEGFDAAAREWSFASSGPLSGANGALAWMVFRRDAAKFGERFPKLRIIAYRPHTPLLYWLAGGLKPWCLVPSALLPAAKALDRALLRLSRDCGTFVDIEVAKTG